MKGTKMKNLQSTRCFSYSIAALIFLSMAVLPAHAATIQVTTTTDERADPGPGSGCSLREAIQSINNGSNFGGCSGTSYGSGDSINLPAGTYAIAISGSNEDLNVNGDYDITKSVVISGAGQTITTIQGDGSERVLDITGSYTVAIDGVTITGGVTNSSGGGIKKQGATLTVSNSTIKGNQASGAGGIASGGGPLTITNSTIKGNQANSAGGIDSWGGLLTLTNSTISDNEALGGEAGGVDCGDATVTNSTISGNRSVYDGGGMDVDGILVMTNSTISGNTVTDDDAGGLDLGDASGTITNSTIVGNTASGAGGGLYEGRRITFINTIVADNVGGDCGGFAPPFVTDGGGNIDSDGSCGTFTQDTNMVQGTGFGPLANNGGPTQTHALLKGSTAIDAAPDCARLTNDQRGVARPQGSACDSGAYEYREVKDAARVPALPGWALIMLLAGLLGFGGWTSMGRKS